MISRLPPPPQEASHALEAALQLAPSTQTAFNLVLCAFATGDAERTRRAFSILVQVTWLSPMPFSRPRLTAVCLFRCLFCRVCNGR